MPPRNPVLKPDNSQVYRKLTQPAAGGVAGDAGLVGRRPCVLVKNQDTNGYAVVRFVGEVLVQVHGQGVSAAQALADGADLYYDAAPGANNPFVNADSTNGVFFGTLIGSVASGAKVDARVDLR